MSRMLCARMQIMQEEKEQENGEEKNKRQLTWELVRFSIIAIVVVIFVRAFIVQPFIISGSSMVPTFQNKEYLIIDEISYKLSSPQRGDVVVFRYPKDTTKFFIKRIIGLPNETVEIKDAVVIIVNEEHRDGFNLDQPYVKNTSSGSLRLELKNNEYFVMGDNRSASSDSRFWGPVPENLLVGRALLRLWPIGKIDILPGTFIQAE